ncbi:MAG: LarC family nickel insertion protein, partial [Candidatus Hydrothermarchaeota archaeon]|nr:LarC family nickel insertion protein [Candidatus Hydrothermarchaeota archaeon]
MLIYIDPSVSGISGDMALGALLDLGADKKKLLSAADAISRELNCKIKIKIKKIKKNGISATKVEIKEDGRAYPISRLNKALASTVKAVSLSSEAGKFASRVLDTMLDAEAAVHVIPKNKLHLHELGCADTLVDIAGAAALADNSGFFEEGVSICSSPVAVGGGKVRTAHGDVSIPAPVTAQILKKFKIPLKFSGKGELATPTGVALLANLADSYELELPVMRIDAVGIGAGSFNLPNPNILRIMKCKHEELPKEFVSVLETSLDDASGEVLGYTLERLYEEGALDVQIISA